MSKIEMEHWAKISYSEAATVVVLKKKGVPKHFAIFTGKHLCWSLFFIKRRPATLLKREVFSNTGVFL